MAIIILFQVDKQQVLIKIFDEQQKHLYLITLILEQLHQIGKTFQLKNWMMLSAIYKEDKQQRRKNRNFNQILQVLQKLVLIQKVIITIKIRQLQHLILIQILLDISNLKQLIILQKYINILKILLINFRTIFSVNISNLYFYNVQFYL
ncbi:unnamed protein product [Paramecium sonneborni]|uniref:Uncharacterized protein n=1 Tax=Paramecium sonneborni TaxID=65129 RepID=A0A8S1RQV7_9CILI|nr:unnamed protein product [Paramecium sonneborni]